MIFSLNKVNKKAPAVSTAAGAGTFALHKSPSPHAAMINNKKLNGKKQNKGKQKCTVQNNGGVDGGNDVVFENLLIHGQKKSRNIHCSGIGLLFI